MKETVATPNLSCFWFFLPASPHTCPFTFISKAGKIFFQNAPAVSKQHILSYMCKYLNVCWGYNIKILNFYFENIGPNWKHSQLISLSRLTVMSVPLLQFCDVCITIPILMNKMKIRVSILFTHCIRPCEYKKYKIYTSYLSDKEGI